MSDQDQIIGDASSGDPSDPAGKVASMYSALEGARTAIESHCKQTEKGIKIWLGISISAVIFTIIICFLFYTDCRVDKADFWRVIYYSVVRTATIAVLLTFCWFSFGMYRSSSHLHNVNLFRKSLIDSMAALVWAPAEKTNPDDTFRAILAVLVQQPETGLVKSKQTFNELEKRLFELITTKKADDSPKKD